MADLAEIFKLHLLEAGILDTQLSSEFDTSLDGRKSNFGLIERGSPLFEEWLRANTLKVSEICTGKYFGRTALLGLANETNDLSPLIAEHFGGGMMSLDSEKLPTNEVRLTAVTEKIIRLSRPKLQVLVISSIGITGGNTAPIAADVLKAGADTVKVINTWQKEETLVALDMIDVTYHAIFKGPL